MASVKAGVGQLDAESDCEARGPSARAASLERRGAARREQQQLRLAPRRPRGGVGGASSSTTCALVPPMPKELTPARRGAAARGQARELGVDVERGCSRSRARVRLLEVQRRRDLPVLQRQHRLDQAGDARGRVEVADVAS